MVNKQINLTSSLNIYLLLLLLSAPLKEVRFSIQCIVEYVAYINVIKAKRDEGREVYKSRVCISDWNGVSLN